MTEIVAGGAPVVFRGMATRMWSGFREALAAERFLQQFGSTNVGCWCAQSFDVIFVVDELSKFVKKRTNSQIPTPRGWCAIAQ